MNEKTLFLVAATLRKSECCENDWKHFKPD